MIGLTLCGVVITAMFSDEAHARPSEPSLQRYPDATATGWHEEAQGLAHDRDHWFISQRSFLWKVPVGVDLGQPLNGPDPARGILRVPIPAELAGEGYDHFGDPDYYQGILFVPMEGADVSAIAAFMAEDLRYLGFQRLAAQENKAGWCAVDPRSGTLYSSYHRIDATHPLQVYQPGFDADWSFIHLGHVGEVWLTDEHGVPITLDKGWMQGGEFSDEGDLHLVTEPFGVMAFDPASGQRTAQYPIAYTSAFHLQELEGLTIWDLNADSRAPGISGRFHLILLHNGLTDRVSMLHFDDQGSSAIVESASPSESKDDGAQGSEVAAGCELGHKPATAGGLLLLLILAHVARRLVS
jgi:hypothetical protein